MLQLPIYLDGMATTPVDPRVAEKMWKCLLKDGCFGNPASQTHRYGYAAAQLVKQARQQVADLINADPREIIWTSGATESDNLAIKGAALFYQRSGKHIITMSTEHKAVLDSCEFLETQGFEVTYLHPQADGLLDLEKLKAALRKDTILVSIMMVNNELGVIQDIESIAKITHEHGVLFHSDTVQAAGKIPIDVQKLQVDLMSFSAHKIYGPKGIGTLYVRRHPRVRLIPQIHGGGHEWGIRSGTLATHQIVGMGEAFAIAKQEMETESQRILAMRQRLWEAIKQLGGVHLNGHPTQRIPGCLNITIDKVPGEALLSALHDIAVSTSSACSSANASPSHVLTALGLSEDQADRSLRISIGRFTTEEEIDYAIQHICTQIQRLRS